MRGDRRKRRSFNEPRPARELTFSCCRKYPFFKAECTCRWLIDSLEKARERQDFDHWAFVFMPDHIHLVVRPGRLSCEIAAILREIKLPVARQAVRFLEQKSPGWLSKIAQARGRRTEYHFWQPGGGYDRNIIEPETLRRMIDYIHLNPVRRGLVEPTRDRRWSSAAWYEGRAGCDLIPDAIPAGWTDD